MRPQKDYAIISIAMDKGGDNGDYIGKGIDKVEAPTGGLGHKLGLSSSDGKSKEESDVRNAEQNPTAPLDRGAVGKEGSVLVAGEKNQESDKASSSSGWINHTGIKVGATAGNAVGMVMKAKRGGGLLMGAKAVGPAATILIILLACFMSLMVSVSFLVSSLIPSINKAMNTNDIATTVRSRQIITSIMLGKNAKGGLWSSIPDRIKGAFNKAGASVEMGDEGLEVIKTIDSNGNPKTLDGHNFNNEIATDPEIAKTVNDGLARAGGAGLADDSSAEMVVKNFGVESLNRNNAVETGEDPDETKANLDDSLQEDLTKATGDGGIKADYDNSEEKTVVDEATGKSDTTVETGRESKTISSGDDVKNVVDDEIKDGAMEFGGIASQAAKGVCLVYNTAMTINRAVKAYEAAQVISMGLRIFEAIQRMQAGEGVDDIINIIANYLTRPKTTDFELTQGEFTTVTTSAIGSSALAQFYGGTKLTDNDTIVQSFTTSSNQFRKITDSIEGGTGYKACTGANVAASLIDALGEAATLGATKIMSIVVSVAISAAISAAASMIMSIMVPKIVNALKRDFHNFVEGAEGGGVLAWAAEMIIEAIAKMSGMSIGTKKSLETYVQKKADIVAERARIARYTLSPFDTSSEYTFMGSLMASLTRASLNTSSLLGRVGNITSVVGKSLIALTPASHAADAIDEIVTTGDYPELTQLVDDGQERYATAFGEPYYIPHFTDASIEDVMWYFDAMGCFEEPYDPVSNPNPSVKMNGTGIASAKNPIILAIKAGRNPSNDATLAAYSDDGSLPEEFVLADVASSEQNVLGRIIEEKVLRSAPLGVPDAEIEAKYSKVGRTGSSIWDKVISAIPVIGSIIDVVNGVDMLAHMGRILGYEYHTNSKLNQMAEHYVHDQRIAEAMGAIQKSQVTAYIEKYYEEHPTDNTMIGKIARLSGLTKEQVATSFKQINALNFIASYRPDGLGPLFFEHPSVEITLESSSDYRPAIVGILYCPMAFESQKAQNITA